MNKFLNFYKFKWPIKKKELISAHQEKFATSFDTKKNKKLTTKPKFISKF